MSGGQNALLYCNGMGGVVKRSRAQEAGRSARDPHRANIVPTDGPWDLLLRPLDGQFSAFGRVTEGIDVVERISQVPVGADGLTEAPVRILKVTLEKKKAEPYLTATLDELRKTVTLKTTLGSLKIEMQPDWAPNHVRNFLKLVSTGWYNGTAFHRVAKDAMSLFSSLGVEKDDRVAMVIGATPEIHRSLRSNGSSMATVIANEYAEAIGEMHLSALTEIGLALFIVTIIVNALAQVLIWMVTRDTPAQAQ